MFPVEYLGEAMKPWMYLSVFEFRTSQLSNFKAKTDPKVA